MWQSLFTELRDRGLIVVAAAMDVPDAARQWIEAAKPDWRLKKQKLGSYEVLAARGEAMLAKKAARVEQRESDEHAAKILRMRAERA